MTSHAHGLTDFSPSGSRGEKLDQGVRAGLADSLCKIAEALSDAEHSASESVLQLAASVRQHPVSSRVMASYVEAVEALAGEDDERALAAIRTLADPALRRPATRRVLSLNETDLGPGMPAVYLRQVNDNQSSRQISLPCRRSSSRRTARASKTSSPCSIACCPTSPPRCAR